MKILVCVKQVPDTSGPAAVNEDGTLDRSKMLAITNPDDLGAVEAALQLKEQTGCEVVVITMGPSPAEAMLRELLAMGADKALLVSAREFGGSDTYATSQILAAAIQTLGFEPEDMILCGRQAIDGDTAQVGPQIAEKMNIPQISYVSEIKVSQGSVVCKRLLEDGYMTVKTSLPCLLTCVKEIAEPRFMSVSGIMEAFDKEVIRMGFEDLSENPLIHLDTIGLKGSPTNILKSFTPPPYKGSTIMLEGAPKEACAELYGRLAERHLI